MIKVGDKVKFLNDVGGGVVTSFIGKNMVNVENEDGFEIPYPISQLVNVSSPQVNKIENTRSKEETKEERIAEPVFKQNAGEIIKGKNEPNFYFCFVPSNTANPVDGKIDLVLANDSNFTLLYHFSHHYSDQFKTIKFGTIQSNSKLVLESLVQNELNDLPEYAFQLLYFMDQEKELKLPISKTFKLNPVKFYKESSFKPNPLFPQNAIVLQISNDLLSTELDRLTQQDLKKVVREKENSRIPKQKVKKRTPEIVEVDLHINELLDDAEGLSKREILGIQMDKVESEMNWAIRNNLKKIVFIHGVGQGVLKQEVANLLKRKFKKYYFQDASFKEYGYGATMVTLKKN